MGTAPQNNDEVVIDAGSGRDREDRDQGTRSGPHPDPVSSRSPASSKYGDQNSLGGTTYVGMTYDAAQKYLAVKGELRYHRAQGRRGVNPEDLVQRVQPLLPRTPR